MTIRTNAAMKRLMAGMPDVLPKIRVEVNRTALLVHGEARKRAPVRTGRLRASTTPHTNLPDMTAEVRVHVNYAIYNEARKAFLKPSADKYRRAFVQEIKNILTGR